MIKIKDLKSYEKYIELQKEKTKDPRRRATWEAALRGNTKKFIPTFYQYIDHFEHFKKGNVFCLGARTGEEALALRLLGFENALGTDLVPYGRHVIEDDKYGVCSIETPEDFHLLAGSKGLSVYKSNRNTVKTPHNHGLNWNIILEKRRNKC